MKAKDIRVGDVFGDDTGVRRFKVGEVRPTNAFKMGLEGYPDKFAIMVIWQKTRGEQTLYHPDEDVGEPLQRASPA